jgi:protease-4
MSWIARVAAGVAGTVLAACAMGAAPQASVGLLKVHGRPATLPGPLDWLSGGDPEAPTLREIVEAIRTVEADESLAGVVVQLKDAELSASMIEEVGAAMARARQNGKKVHVFSDAWGPAELMLATYADGSIAQSGAPVSLPGLYMEEMFLADTLQWAGLKADMVQIGDYKGAAEMMSRSAPSPQWDQNITQLLDSLYGNMRGKLKSGRKLTDDALDQAMRQAWMTDAQGAVKVGLIDKAIDLPMLTDELKSVYDAEAVAWRDDLVPVDTSQPGMESMFANPFVMMQKLFKKPEHTPTGPTIAVLHLQGVIVDGESSYGGLMGGDPTVGSRTVRNAIEDILDEEQIKGVVVRIDSPGGSATASEVIWQGLRRLAEKKKTWVSVGSMAASGGYYCAVAGEKIYVNPSSIVGSIGVVGGKYSMAGLYQKLKVNTVSRARGPMASIFRSTTDWTEQELAAVRGKMTETYNQFTSRVTAGREGIDLSKTAEGRLFTGDKALELKMADRVGGFELCVEELAAELGLGEYEVMDYPGPLSLEEFFRESFGSARSPRLDTRASAEAELFGTLRAVVGERAWPQVRRSLQGALLLRDQPVILMSPSVLIFK